MLIDDLFLDTPVNWTAPHHPKSGRAVESRELQDIYAPLEQMLMKLETARKCYFEQFLQTKFILAWGRETYRGYRLKTQISVGIISRKPNMFLWKSEKYASWFWQHEGGEILVKFIQSILRKQAYSAGKLLYNSFIPAGKRALLWSSTL